jgi:hypothetical protein
MAVVACWVVAVLVLVLVAAKVATADVPLLPPAAATAVPVDS